jgi:hypothetical protein
MNREQWLTEVSELLKPVFLLRGVPIKHRYRITCGWPCRFGLSIRQRRIGECHSGSVSGDKVSEVFISPTIDDPIVVAGVVCHELIHVAVGTKEGHKGKFRLGCRYLGMTGKMTQAIPGEKLEEIRKLIEPLGEYPHKAMTVPTKLVARSIPLMKLICECGCVVRISQTDLDTVGFPTCGCGLLFGSEE